MKRARVTREYRIKPHDAMNRSKKEITAILKLNGFDMGETIYVTACLETGDFIYTQKVIEELKLEKIKGESISCMWFDEKWE